MKKTQGIKQYRYYRVVTARPFGERDVNYRSISGPLVASLHQIDTNKLRVKMDILRPGIYHALTEHLAQRLKGYYHIIHFDVHGVLLTHAQLQQGLTATRYLYENLETFTNQQPFLFLETSQEQQSEPIPAQTLAHLLRSYQIPIVILNACESGKQVGITETSLSGQFMQAGIPMVLAMRYTVTASS